MKRPTSFKLWSTIAHTSTAAAVIAASVSLYCVGWTVYTKRQITFQGQQIYAHSSMSTDKALKLEQRPAGAAQPVNWSNVASRAQAATVLIEISGRYRYDREWITGYQPNPVLEAAHGLYLRLSGGYIESDYPWRKAGAGVFIGKSGEILTAAHVVNQHSRYRITSTDGTQAVAKLIGMDEQQDIAILKVAHQSGLAAPLASTAKLPVGAPVIAVGTPEGEPFTVTAGIVTTSKQRFWQSMYDDFLGVDARIVGGNSGGGIFNQEGQLVGILSFGGAYQSLGYAVPIDRAKEVIKRYVGI